MWKVVASSNLNPPLKLFFYSPILTNNNLLLKIYCENIVVTFLNQDFYSLYYFSFLSFHFIHTFFFFFLLHTRCPISIPSPPLLFLFLPHSRTFQHQQLSFSLFFSPTLSLSLSLSLFNLIPKHSSLTQSRWVIFIPKQLAQPETVNHLHPQRNLDGSNGFCLLSFVFFFSFSFLLLLL